MNKPINSCLGWNDSERKLGTPGASCKCGLMFVKGIFFLETKNIFKLSHKGIFIEKYKDIITHLYMIYVYLEHVITSSMWL